MLGKIEPIGGQIELNIGKFANFRLDLTHMKLNLTVVKLDLIHMKLI